MLRTQRRADEALGRETQSLEAEADEFGLATCTGYGMSFCCIVSCPLIQYLRVTKAGIRCKATYYHAPDTPPEKRFCAIHEGQTPDEARAACAKVLNGYKRPRLFKFIPWKNVVYDSLHTFLRISDRLIDLVVGVLPLAYFLWL